MFSCESDEIMNGEKIRDFRSSHGLFKDVKQYWPEVTAEIYKSLSYGIEYYRVCLYSITNITLYFLDFCDL